jgi:hypothetical protein
MRFTLRGEANLSFKDVDGNGAIGMVLLHLRGWLHRDQNSTKVGLLEQGLRVVTGLPRLLALRVGDLACEIELGKFIKHVAVVV